MGVWTWVHQNIIRLQSRCSNYYAMTCLRGKDLEMKDSISGTGFQKTLLSLWVPLSILQEFQEHNLSWFFWGLIVYLVLSLFESHFVKIIQCNNTEFQCGLCCVFQPENASCRMHSHGRKQWKTLENHEIEFNFILLIFF